MKLLLLAPFLAIPLAGCAYLHSVTVRTLDPRTNSVAETTQVRCYTFFDGQSALAKFRNTTGATGSNGFVFPSGTSIGALNQESSGTNAISLIEAVSSGATQGALQWYSIQSAKPRQP